MNEKKNKEAIRLKLEQAKESLEEARALLAEGAELSFVMNSLYYAFLYPVLGLLQARGIEAPMQSVAISLFEREFVQKGDLDHRFLDAVRKAFDLRPACACEGGKKAAREDIEQLLPLAEEFLENIRRIIA